MSSKPEVSFRQNAPGYFGDVLRSSGIFYVKSDKNFKTVISFMDYWKLKRGVKVCVVASVREMDGTLIRRKHLNFDDGTVVNFIPFEGSEPFEGSCEIEVFSLENLAIPYAAIMAIYETPRGITMVHSYGRTYSRHEVEEGRTISSGTEGCWTLRDSVSVQSIGVIHNGGVTQPVQRAKLEIKNGTGETKTTHLEIPELAPYATFVIRPSHYIDDLAVFLDGCSGQAAISYSVNESFTRMLVGNEAVDGSDFQVTHSNFDYRAHKTDVLEAQGVGYMRIPSGGVSGKSILIYPHANEGSYSWSSSSASGCFKSGDAIEIPVSDSETILRFSRADGPFPTRLVTGLVMPGQNNTIANECSLGVLTELQPKKRFWWGVCAAGPSVDCKLIINDLPEIYGGIPSDEKIQIGLHSINGHTPLTVEVSATELDVFDQGHYIRTLFPSAQRHLDGTYGYFTVFCEYGGLTCYTTLEHKSGSIALEHAF
jgi:hypothetical protein